MTKLDVAILDAKDEHVTPEQALERMQAAVRGPKDRDARFDADLEDKFRDEGGGR